MIEIICDVSTSICHRTPKLCSSSRFNSIRKVYFGRNIPKNKLMKQIKIISFSATDAKQTNSFEIRNWARSLNAYPPLLTTLSKKVQRWLNQASSSPPPCCSTASPTTSMTTR